MVFVFFFFNVTATTQIYTSFPTRRSSDLAADSRSIVRVSGSTMTFSSTVPNIRVVARSEEHTSELQSQFHLVCRLLLEKKKMYIAAHMHDTGETEPHDGKSFPIALSKSGA